MFADILFILLCILSIPFLIALTPFLLMGAIAYYGYEIIKKFSSHKKD